MEYGQFDRNGTTKIATVDQNTMSVESYNPKAIDTNSWEKLDMGSDTDYLIGKVICNDDGLRYRMVIEIMDWDAATGDGDKVFEIQISDHNDLLHGRRFRTEKEAEEHLANLPALSELKADEDVETLQELCHKVIQEIDIPTYMVSLYVVPVSVPQEVIERILGSDINDWMLEAHAKHGDWRENVWDICTYGHHVPIAVRDLEGEMSNGIKVNDDRLPEVIEMLQATAQVVEGMFGFYMDRRVNAMGESGWDWLRNAKAFPGQHKVKVRGKRKRECDDCGTKDFCVGFKTIYSKSRKKHYLCEKCQEGWYTCPDCGILVPIEPQSWAGVEWIEIRGAYYCHDCASKVMSEDPPHVLEGHTLYDVDALKEYFTPLSGIHLKGWEQVEEWEIGFDYGPTEMDMAKEVSDLIFKGKETDKFIFGSTHHAQFVHWFGLFKKVS